MFENSNNFIGYEYKDVITSRELEGIYADSYPSFGWSLDGAVPIPIIGMSTITLKFKRDRKIRNKAELTRLQRQFESYISEIIRMEKSKSVSASITAFTVGIIGTAFVAGATFSYLANFILLCIILAIPGFIGWILPYFLYNLTYAKKTNKLTPLIEVKYDEIYEVCEKGNGLLE